MVSSRSVYWNRTWTTALVIRPRAASRYQPKSVLCDNRAVPHINCPDRKLSKLRNDQTRPPPLAWSGRRKVRMWAKAWNVPTRWRKTKRRRATRKRASAKWGKRLAITDSERGNSSSGVESRDWNVVTLSAALATLTRWFNLCGIVEMSTCLYGLLEGAHTLAGRQKWWEERHSGSTLVGVGSASAANQRRGSQRGPQPQDVDAQRADEDELSGIVSQIGNGLHRYQ